MYAVENADLRTRGTVFDKHVMHLRDVRRSVDSWLLSVKSIDPWLDIDFWTYRTNGEVEYVAALAALPAEQVSQ